MFVLKLHGQCAVKRRKIAPRDAPLINHGNGTMMRTQRCIVLGCATNATESGVDGVTGGAGGSGWSLSSFKYITAPLFSTTVDTVSGRTLR